MGAYPLLSISTCLPTSSASSPLCYSSIPLSWFFALFFLHPNASLHYRSSCGYPTNATKTKYNLSAKFSNEDWEASSPRRHHPLFILILSVPCPSKRETAIHPPPLPSPACSLSRGMHVFRVEQFAYILFSSSRSCWSRLFYRLRDGSFPSLKLGFGGLRFLFCFACFCLLHCGLRVSWNCLGSCVWRCNCCCFTDSSPFIHHINRCYHSPFLSRVISLDAFPSTNAVGAGNT